MTRWLWRVVPVYPLVVGGSCIWFSCVVPVYPVVRVCSHGGSAWTQNNKSNW